MRTYRITMTKFGFAPDKQPTPPAGDDPAAVEQLVHDALHAVVNLEHALHRVTDRAAATAPVSTAHVHKLRCELALHTMSWLSNWPTTPDIEEPEEWATAALSSSLELATAAKGEIG